jgi:hypothetical protein
MEEGSALVTARGQNMSAEQSYDTDFASLHPNLIISKLKDWFE